jgi:large subunit ribosomal protein L4
MTTTAPETVGHVRRPRHKVRPEPVVRTVDRRDMSGAVLGQVDLAPEIFGIEPNGAVLHQVVTAQLAAARAGTQSTKTRAQVRGGGAKPYRQKGTGRARQGSTRAPHFVGGGVALGPQPRSYRQRTPKKMVRLALYSALSDRAAAGQVALVDRWSFETPKTKEAAAALTALGLDGHVLVVLGADERAAERSFANLPTVRTVRSGELNAHDVVRHDWVVFSDATLPGRFEVDETVIEVLDPETGDRTIEIIDELVDTETGDELVVVTEITEDGATGERVIEVTEELVDGSTGEVLIVADVDMPIDDEDDDIDQGDEIDTVPATDAAPETEESDRA